MLQTKNILLGKARVYILVFFTYYLLMNNSLSENDSRTEIYAVLTILDLSLIHIDAADDL